MSNGHPELDLASTEGPLEPKLVPLEKQQTVPFDPVEAQEKVRGRIAYALLALLGGVVMLGYLTLWGTMYLDQMSPDQPPTANQVVLQDQPTPPEAAPSTTSEFTLGDLLTLVFTPILGLLGAATGFYYGGVTAKQ